MSAPQWRQPVGVIARLLAEPHHFGFFQAVRLLDRWFSERDGRSASGHLTPRLYFRNTLSLGFPASEIAELHVDAEPPGQTPDGPVEDGCEGSSSVEGVQITPAFMGLLGVTGTLPVFYTELLADRETYHRDKAARAFLDIFQHRAITLFYESWRKHRLPIQYERDHRNKFLPLVLALAGVGQSALRYRLRANEGGVADDTIAYFAGLLQQRPISAASIAQIVGEYFSVCARIDQFVGRWFDLPSDGSSCLGLENVTLGTNALVGVRLWQRDQRMRLTLGPMRRDSLRRFLPGGTGALALRELLTMMSGRSIEYEVRLALEAEEVKGMALEVGPGGANLGWDSFLVTLPVVCERDDAGYDIHAHH